MTITDWLNDSTGVDERLDDHREPTKSSLLEKVRLFLLRRRINAMLRRTVAPTGYDDVGTLPPRLMRDIGFTPPV